MSKLKESRAAVDDLVQKFRSENRHSDYIAGYLSEVAAQMLSDMSEEQRNRWIEQLSATQQKSKSSI